MVPGVSPRIPSRNHSGASISEEIRIRPFFGLLYEFLESSYKKMNTNPELQINYALDTLYEHCLHLLIT